MTEVKFTRDFEFREKVIRMPLYTSSNKVLAFVLNVIFEMFLVRCIVHLILVLMFYCFSGCFLPTEMSQFRLNLFESKIES